MAEPLPLPGCTPEPLMGYLKALGVFRLVAKQADPEARLSWAGGCARLHTTLGRDGLTDFFLSRYRPTPVVTPWNSASGFAPTKADNKSPKDKAAKEAVARIENSGGDRLELYRAMIRCLRALPRGNEKDADWKQQFFTRCRAAVADEVVPWLDTCFALTTDRIVGFSLLGSGGNDGVTDFGSLFLQRVVTTVVAPGGGEGGERNRGWVQAALFGDNFEPVLPDTVGQFNPGGAGGANGVQGRFDAGPRVNPWDFVLMIEGVLLLAGSVARRLGTNAAARAAFPFTVDSVAVGYGSAVASEETSDASRAELWLPLWEQPGTLAEVAHLFAEGCAQLGRRQAANAVEFALAANLLGVSRGVTAFTRYGFLKRNGLAFLATPLGRVSVTPRPAARLLADPALLTWIDSLRRACRDKDRTPARYQTALRQIDRAMFEFATRSELGNDAKYLLRVLAALGRAERTLAGGLRFCKGHGVRPLQGLSPQWLELDSREEGSPDYLEFRLAAALGGVGRTKEGEVGSIRTHLEEVEQKGEWFDWSPGSPSAVWSRGTLAVNLAAVFRRRLTEAFRGRLPGVPLRSRHPARLDDITAFLNGETDDDALQDLLWGLVGVNWREVKRGAHPPAPQRATPAEYGIPRLVVESHAFVCHTARRKTPQPGQPTERLVWRLAKDLRADANAKPDPDVFYLLASGQADAVEQCVTRAARRLRSGGLLVTGYRNRRLAGRPLAVISAVRSDRLLAAMLFPLSRRDRARVANAVLYPPESET